VAVDRTSLQGRIQDLRKVRPGDHGDRSEREPQAYNGGLAGGNSNRIQDEQWKEVCVN